MLLIQIITAASLATGTPAVHAQAAALHCFSLRALPLRLRALHGTEIRRCDLTQSR